MKPERVFAYTFASIYPHYLKKVDSKGRTKDELDQVLEWLTGYDSKGLQNVIESRADLRTFFEQAPKFNEKASQIKGVICGVRVEEITDPLMQKIRYMDKLVDELAKGKALTKVMRQD